MKKRFLVVAAIFISSQLQAQQDTSYLDEVIITANKYPNKASLTGKVVSIISRQQLERSGGKDLSQLLTEQAGIYINGANSNMGKDKSVFLRGARVDHTLITIDGIPVYDASGIGGNFDIRNIPIDHIERIEILKGSQSTLYGSDAIAGVINIITRKSGTKPLGASGVLSYGSNQLFRANAGLQGKKGLIDYNLGLGFLDTRGINEAIQQGPVSVTDKDGYEQQSLQASLGIQARKNIRLQPFFRYTKLEGDIDQGAFTDELDYTYKQTSWQAGIRNEWTIGRSKLNLLYNYNHIDRQYRDDSLESRNGFYTFSNGRYKGGEHFIDGYLHLPLNQKLKLTAGVDFRNSVSDQDYYYVSSWGDGFSKLSSDSLAQNQLGFYAAFDLHLPTGLNLEIGNRLNIHSEYGANHVFNINPSYLLNNKIKFFANLSSAFRTPSLYQLFSEYGNRELQPESALTLEAGLQYFSGDNMFMARAVGFGRRVHDVIFFYFNPVTFQSQYINQDKQKDHGIELEAGYSPLPQLQLKAFYTYTTGKINTFQNGKDTVYFNLLRRPRHSIGINAGYKVCPNLFISSNLQAVGKREDAYFDANSFSTVYTTLDNYYLLDFYAEYALLSNKLKLFADLRNITNSKYTEVSGFATLGFNGYGGVRINF